MRIVERLTPFLGAWSGVDRLRLLPPGDDRESARHRDGRGDRRRVRAR